MGAVALGEAVQVGAGAEELLAGTGDHHGAHFGVGVDLCHQLAQLLQAFRSEGVGGRAAQRQRGDVAVQGELDHCLDSLSAADRYWRITPEKSSWPSPAWLTAW
ncbi:hypothetical protein D3C80_1839060 [compost metagenome]